MTLEVDRQRGGYVRWRCSCGQVGFWRHLSEGPGQQRFEAVRAWMRHLREQHPDVEIEVA